MKPTHFIKINSGWMIDLYLKGSTIKILGENIEEYLLDFGAKYFLERTFEQKEKITNWITLKI